MKSQKFIKGFTLIELMIVIAIIGILMAYAIPAYRDFTTRTLIGEGNVLSSPFKTSVSIAYHETSSLIGLNNGARGIGSSNVIGNCVNNIAVADGEITVTFDCSAGTNGTSNAIVDGSEIVWTPRSTGSYLQWTCTMNGSVSTGQDVCPK